jgi:hypothetical protein
VAAVAAALFLIPTAAMAYEAPGYDATVSDATPALGVPVAVNMTGADANEAVTLTVTSVPASISNDDIQIAGTKAMTKRMNASGAGTFMVTLRVSGTYNLTMTDPAGATLSTQTLAAGTAGAAAGVAGATTGAQLSKTGFDGMGLAIGGVALVLAGAGAVVVARRRRPVSVPA